MFCSKCGKTLNPEEATCPFCAEDLTGTRLVGAITSSQAPIPPESAGSADAAYTRTTFTSMTDEEISRGDRDGRTTYRPIQQGSAPEDVLEGMRDEMRERAEAKAAEAEAAQAEAEGAEAPGDKKGEDEWFVPETSDETSPEDDTRPRIALEDLPQEALSTLSAVDEELQIEEFDTSDLQTRPIESAGRAGISANVEQYMQRLEATRQRRGRRWPGLVKRARTPEEAEEQPTDIEEQPDEAGEQPVETPVFRRRRRRPAEGAEPAAEDVVQTDAAETDEAQPDAEKPRRRRRRKQAQPAEAAAEDVAPEDAFLSGDDAGDAPEEGYEEIDGEGFEEIPYGNTFTVRNIIKVALIMLVTAALIVGGVLWFRNFRSRQVTAPIEGVTQSLYDEGLAAIKSHTEESYKSELMGIYSQGNNTLADFTARIAEDSAALNALIPDEPAINDALFVSALQNIQSSIGNAILYDALAQQQGTTDTETSEGRWNQVNNAIARLEAASTATELTEIQNEEIIMAAATATPAPTPKATYQTLVKDDKSDAVLEMQNRLYVLGFLRDDRDGSFGTKTQTAVKQFQQAAGLPVTGKADNETLTRLYADDAPRTKYAQATPKPKKK